jgi:DNA invertase Pin-like site-specific DNA recombinase
VNEGDQPIMPKKKPLAVEDGPPKLIGLVRVSTGKQEESGLGLDAQRTAIERYRAQVGGMLLRIYTEVESGTHDDIENRPQLRAAVADAGLAHARLVIAKIDRMVRSTAVMAYLKASSVRFVACDNPHANELTIDILVAVAADEARRISTRTREALAAYKSSRRVSKRIRAAYPDGVPADVAEATAGRLGASLPQCRNLTGDAQRLGTRAAAIERTRRARVAYAHLTPLMRQLRAEGLSLEEIACRLNADGHRTVNDCAWNRGQVRRVLGRV